MNFQGLEFMTWDEFMTWLATDGQRLVLPGLGLAIVVLIFAIWKSFKIGIDRVTLAVATTLVLAFSAEGFFEVLNESLALPAAMALLFAIIGESLGIRFARLAHLHHQKHGVLGPNGRRVWYVAAIFGVIVAFNGQNWVERMLRLALPLLGALLWSSGYLADEPPGEQRDAAITWRWHPRRLAILFGIIEPGERDLATVHRERLIRALTATAHGFHHGKHLKRLRRRRLRRLALHADDGVVDEVAARIQRVHLIEHLTAPASLDVYRSRLDIRSASGNPTPTAPLEPAAQRDPAGGTGPTNGAPSATDPIKIPPVDDTHRDSIASNGTAEPVSPAPTQTDTAPGAPRPIWAQAAPGPFPPPDAVGGPVPSQATGTNPAVYDRPPVSPQSETTNGKPRSEQAGFNTETFSEQSTSDAVSGEGEQKPPSGGGQRGQSEDKVDVDEPDKMASRQAGPDDEQPGEPAEKPFVLAMRRFWDQEVAKGNLPTGASLSKAAGVDPSTGLGRRKRREWEKELPGHLRRTASAGT